MANLIKLGQGMYNNYSGIASKDQYQVYFTTDTHQIFVGADEYTKGTKTLAAVPTEATPGETGVLYAVDGSLYLCSGGSAGAYVWTRVANINDVEGTVTSVAAGEGLETESGSAITDTGTIKHSVPVGAAVTADSTTASGTTLAFGGTVDVQGVATDKFGHVTGAAVHTLTLPTETVVSVTPETGTPQTLTNGGTFTVVSGVTKGTGTHEVEAETTTFTLPTSTDTTYTISSVEEGVVTLTPSSGDATTAKINGWDDLAKKADITSVFRYKGSVATVADLPAVAEVGDVYQVQTGPQGTSEEYVCVTAGTAGGSAAVWEELGPTVDLSAYATTAYVQTEIETALTWRTF